MKAKLMKQRLQHQKQSQAQSDQARRMEEFQLKQKKDALEVLSPFRTALTRTPR